MLTFSNVGTICRRAARLSWAAVSILNIVVVKSLKAAESCCGRNESLNAAEPCCGLCISALKVNSAILLGGFWEGRLWLLRLAKIKPRCTQLVAWFNQFEVCISVFLRPLQPSQIDPHSKMSLQFELISSVNTIKIRFKLHLCILYVDCHVIYEYILNDIIDHYNFISLEIWCLKCSGQHKLFTEMPHAHVILPHVHQLDKRKRW